MDSHKRLPQWSDHFPAGLRVLVVDNDPTHSNLLQHMLTACNYQVTTCNTMRAALDLLRRTGDGFDVVISDFNLPDMDGFKLLEHVALKMRIPVIVMSVDGETSRVMRGVEHGACDYLLKPIRMEELRNIWQHVVRKRILEGRDIVVGQEKPPGVHSGDDASTSGRKRKDVGDGARSHDGESCGDATLSVKKARVVWSTALHQKFVKAVNQIGVDKAGPKKILDFMGVTWLTRENVASHLQKYRLYLRRQQQENELKPASDWMVSRISSVDPSSSGSVCLQSSITQTSATTVQHNVVTNVPQHKVQIHRDDAKGIVSLPMASTHTNALLGDADYLPISASRINFNRFIGAMDSESRNKTQFQSGHHFDHLTVPSTGEAHSAPLCSANRGYDDESNKDALVSEWSMKNHNMTHGGVYDHLESSLKCLIVGTGGSTLTVWDDEFNGYSNQGDLCPLNQDDYINVGLFSCRNPEVVDDVSQQMYDPASFDSGEPLECLQIDCCQGLSTP